MECRAMTIVCTNVHEQSQKERPAAVIRGVMTRRIIKAAKKEVMSEYQLRTSETRKIQCQGRR